MGVTLRRAGFLLSSIVLYSSRAWLGEVSFNKIYKMKQDLQDKTRLPASTFFILEILFHLVNLVEANLTHS